MKLREKIVALAEAAAEAPEESAGAAALAVFPDFAKKGEALIAHVGVDTAVEEPSKVWMWRPQARTDFGFTICSLGGDAFFFCAAMFRRNPHRRPPQRTTSKSEI